MAVVQRVDSLHSIEIMLQSLLLCVRSDTVVEVFQEVRFTRAIVAVDPDTDVVVRFVVLDGIENAVETVHNLIGEHVFIDFYFLCVRVELGSTYSRIDRTADIQSVYFFLLHST